MKAPYAFLNAFTTSPTSGNPAALVLLPTKQWPQNSTLQEIAKTFNKPMTAFLLPSPTSSLDSTTGKYNLRWFNPTSEQWICGHATIALSSYLFSLPNPPKSLELLTERYGTVNASIVFSPFNDEEEMVAIDFPELVGFEVVSPESWRFGEVFKVLNEGLGGDGVKVVEIMELDGYLLIEVDPLVDLGTVKIDTSKLNSLPSHILITQVSQPTSKAGKNGEHIHTRVIVNLPNFQQEDSATGSAHCAIIPYYLSHKPAYGRLTHAHQSTNFIDCSPTSSIPIPKPNTSNSKSHPNLSNDWREGDGYIETYDEGMKIRGKGDGYTLRVRQLSERGGEMVVSWLTELDGDGVLKSDGRVRIMGRAVEVERGFVDVPVV